MELRIVEGCVRRNPINFKKNLKAGCAEMGAGGQWGQGIISSDKCYQLQLQYDLASGNGAKIRKTTIANEQANTYTAILNYTWLVGGPDSFCYGV